MDTILKKGHVNIHDIYNTAELVRKHRMKFIQPVRQPMVLISQIQRKYNTDPEELIDLINDNDLNPEIKIILVSELYDPEVIITAEWLNDRYGLDITAFAVSLHKLNDQYFVNFEQRLPLKEL